jgi:NTP pyrophosphatase (non-canonical NTP hydrolase)
MKRLEELQILIIEWAKEKDLLHSENAPKQRLKLLEEVGETAKAILKSDIAEQKDGLGDIFVVLVILAKQIESEMNFDLWIHTHNGNKLFRIIEIAKRKNLFFCLNDLHETSLHLGHDLTECANLVWNEIKDRKGKTINGTFIKN